MPIDLMCISGNSLILICKYTDDKSLMRMRMCSKAIKETIEISLLNIRSTEVGSFVVKRENRRNKNEICFLLYNLRDYSIWKICVSSLFPKLGVARFHLDDDCTSIDFSIKSYDVERFLEEFKPFLHELHLIERVEFDHDKADRIKILTNFLKNRKVKCVDVIVKKEKSELSPWLNFVQKVKAKTFDCFFPNKQLSKESINFLKQLSSIVLEIIIRGCKIKPSTIMVPIAQCILDQKCEMLKFAGSISIEDACKLIEFLHHLDKECYFTSCTENEPMIQQFGEYIVEIKRPYQAWIRSMLRIKLIEGKYSTEYF